MISERIFVFYANEYSFSNEDGSNVSGCSIHYLNSKDLLPFDDKEGKSKGFRFTKGTMPIGTLKKLPYVPGFYDGDFEPSTDSKGNLTLKLVNLVPVNPIKK